MAKRGKARKKAIIDIELKEAEMVQLRDRLGKAKDPAKRAEMKKDLVDLEYEVKALRRSTYGGKRKGPARKKGFLG